MRNFIPFTSLLLPITALQISPAPAAFLEPYTVNHVTILSTSVISIPHELKRQFAGGCPAQHNRCTQPGYGAACCTQGSFCTTDAARMLACCPNGATCTGTIGGAANPTSSNAFNAPAASPQVTLVPNSYFPFPIIAQNYPGGSTQCETALTACQNNYKVCTDYLIGGNGAFGVTINAPNGGGLTQAATPTRLSTDAAVGVCSSLSQAACRGLTNSLQCTVFGAGTGGSFVVGPTGNAAPRATAAVGCVAGMVAGMGIGIAGQMM